MRISDWSSDVCSSDLLPPLLARLLPGLDGHGALVDELTRALIETPPVDAAQGGYIAAGHDAALDALRETARDGRSEEPTSELQSLIRISYSVFCLKKNNKHKMT